MVRIKTSGGGTFSGPTKLKVIVTSMDGQLILQIEAEIRRILREYTKVF